MKRIAVFSIVLMLFALSVLNAETAYWFVADSENYKLKTGELFSDDVPVGRSNIYSIGSVVDITSEDTKMHSIVTIADTLKSPDSGIADIELSAAAMEELGIFSSGHGSVSISIVREGEAKESPDVNESGWFFYDCGSYSSSDECFQIYSRLIRNGLKPSVALEDGMLHLTVPHIREYQKSDTEKRIALSGIEIAEIQGENNPYLR